MFRNFNHLGTYKRLIQHCIDIIRHVRLLHVFKIFKALFVYTRILHLKTNYT